ncbi:hypothetical protein F53441_8430 [Fusarium austroafricanum]|uniref:Uncharacterized protein n=1 Tax=Fusarium austroafricanum TaxID=2364996 RepID=A0A8H4KE56_9HYPO|nr:hypothetical protein F53441_8430 [Fusarium austroafricanum]
MNLAKLEDVLRPTNDTFKAFYERGYRTWYKLWAAAVDDRTLSPACLEWERHFPGHPVLPVALSPDEFGLVTAKSTWLSSQGHCNASAIEQAFQMPATIGKSTSVVLVDNPELSLSEWFGKDDGHLVVLMFAWAYALFARWAEIIPRASPMQYTTSQAPWLVHPDLGEVTEHGGLIVIELGELTGEAARWWTAIFGPGEGWKVAIPHEQWRLLSPWSITKEFNDIEIFLSGSPGYMNSGSPTPASFETALKYIDEYSILHNASIHSRAALAAALLLPQARLDNRIVLVHAPRGSRRQTGQIETPRPSRFEKRHLRQFDTLNPKRQRSWYEAILGSIFYESGIPANACGVWLQGTIAVLQLQGPENLHLLARMFFDRSPHISYLWLGGIITGTHKDFLQSTSNLLGLNRTDLHAAAWTGTLLSFIQEPVSPIHHDAASISRADECRLMFLTQEPPREFRPIYPYPPLGKTDIRDADLGFQLHAHCPATHGLQFFQESGP